MNLTILSGTSNKYELTCDGTDTIEYVKKMFCKHISLSTSDISAIRLIYCGLELKPNTKTLNQCGIGKFDNWIIHAMVKIVDMSNLPSSSSSSSSSSFKRKAMSSECIDLTDDNVNMNIHQVQSINTTEICDLTNENDDIDISSSIKTRRKPLRKKKHSISSSSSNLTETTEIDNEKRAKRTRIGNERDFIRIQRATSQRLYLLNQQDLSTENDQLAKKFTVLGSTGNVYDVNIAKFPSCTCPDFLKGNICKHILFVMVKASDKSYLYIDSFLWK